MTQYRSCLKISQNEQSSTVTVALPLFISTNSCSLLTTTTSSTTLLSPCIHLHLVQLF